jgi:hypothetical protein
LNHHATLDGQNFLFLQLGSEALWPLGSYRLIVPSHLWATADLIFATESQPALVCVDERSHLTNAQIIRDEELRILLRKRRYKVVAIQLPAHGNASTALNMNASLTCAASSSLVALPANSGTTRLATIRFYLNIRDFRISANPTSLSIPHGSAKSSTITLTSLNGFSGTVTLSPSISTMVNHGSSPSLSPTSVTVSSGGQGTSALTVSTANNTPRRQYTVTVTTTSGSMMHTVTVTVTVYLNSANAGVIEPSNFPFFQAHQPSSFLDPRIECYFMRQESRVYDLVLECCPVYASRTSVR